MPDVPVVKDCETSQEYDGSYNRNSDQGQEHNAHEVTLRCHARPALSVAVHAMADALSVISYSRLMSFVNQMAHPFMNTEKGRPLRTPPYLVLSLPS